MVINHNIASLNANRQMGINQANSSKSMEKLSSGLRINRAGDDAAGLAISEKMRAQVRGLDQASSNGQDGISMIQTAEGALSETHSILQRMRELAVQSSNDTNVAVDRSEIQKEMDELAKEVTRISNNTEFNTQKLINGGITEDGLGSAKFHIGANANQDITLSINAMDAKSLGVSRDVASATVNTANAAGVGSVKTDSTDVTKTLADGDYKLTVVDGVAGATIDAGSTGITGIAVSGTPTDSFSVTLTYHAQVNGTGTQTGANVADGTVTNEATAMGTITRTGAIATADGGNYRLSFTDATNYDILKDDGTGTFVATGDTGTVGAANTSITGTSFTVAAAAGGGAYAAGDTMNFSITADTAANWTTSNTSGESFAASYAATTNNLVANGVTIDLSGAAGNTDGEAVTITGGTTTAQLFASDGTTAIGKAAYINKADGGSYTVGDLTSGQAKVTFEAGEAKSGTSTITKTSVAATTATKVGDAMSDAVVQGGLNVSSQKEASKSVTTIQKAIETVSAERSKLGAYQNRLEHTIANLGTSSENLTAAESRIRDVNMAKEMSTFSKNNILAQAAQSMLAQANQQPQQVLQLLQ